jgi:hypothetical protein
MKIDLNRIILCDLNECELEIIFGAIIIFAKHGLMEHDKKEKGV